MPDAMDLSRIRSIALRNPNIQEIYFNEQSRLVSFRNNQFDWRINVYYTTGTVGTCITHPFAGKTQLFRRNVSCRLLGHIFHNPRMHMEKGYVTKAEAPQTIGRKRSNSEANDETPIGDDDEEAVLAAQLSSLNSQVSIVQEQLSSLRAKRITEEQAAAQRKRQAMEAQRVMEHHRELVMQDIKKQAHLARKAKRDTLINHRGNNCHYSLDYADDLPSSMADVKCVAIAEGGYVAVNDDGTCNWHNIPSNVAAELNRQKNANIDYIALGHWGQYYILKRNGREFYSGCEEFEEDMQRSTSRPKFVSFGDSDTYFVEYENGHKDYSSNLADILPTHVFNTLVSDPVKHFWVGESDGYSPAEFHLVDEANNCYCDFVQGPLDTWYENKRPDRKVKMLLADNDDNFFIRFS